MLLTHWLKDIRVWQRHACKLSDGTTHHTMSSSVPTVIRTKDLRPVSASYVGWLFNCDLLPLRSGGVLRCITAVRCLGTASAYEYYSPPRLTLHPLQVSK